MSEEGTERPMPLNAKERRLVLDHVTPFAPEERYEIALRSQRCVAVWMASGNATLDWVPPEWLAIARYEETVTKLEADATYWRHKAKHVAALMAMAGATLCEPVSTANIREAKKSCDLGVHVMREIIEHEKRNHPPSHQLAPQRATPARRSTMEGSEDQTTTEGQNTGSQTEGSSEQRNTTSDPAPDESTKSDAPAEGDEAGGPAGDSASEGEVGG